MELGESAEDTARRELREETALKVDKLELLGVYSGPEHLCRAANGDEWYVITIAYTTDCYSGQVKINDGESIALAWFAPEAMPEGLVSTHKKILADYLRRRDAAFSALLQTPEAQAFSIVPSAEVLWCPGLEKLSALETLTMGKGNLLVRIQPGESALAVASSIAALKARLHGEILLTNAEALPAEDAGALFSAGARCVLPLAVLADRERRAALLPWLEAGSVAGIGSAGGESVRPYRGLRKGSRKLGRTFDALMRASAALAWPEEP